MSNGNTALQISLPVEALQLAMVEALCHGLRAMADTLEGSAPRQIAKIAKVEKPAKDSARERKSERGCDVKGCPLPHRSLGLCNSHYQKPPFREEARARKAAAGAAVVIAPAVAPAPAVTTPLEATPGTPSPVQAQESSKAAEGPIAETVAPKAEAPPVPTPPAPVAAPEPPPSSAVSGDPAPTEEAPTKPLPRFPPPKEKKGKR